MRLEFKNWLIDLIETFLIGKYKGKELSDPSVPTSYLTWAYWGMDRPGMKFDQWQKLVAQELSRRRVPIPPKPNTVAANTSAPTNQPLSQQQPQAATQQKPAAGVPQSMLWIWAKSIGALPDFGLPVANLDLAVREHFDDEGKKDGFMFVILDPKENRLVSRGLIPIADAPKVMKTQKNEQGVFTLTGKKPTEILEALKPKKKPGDNDNIIDPEKITDEQKAIDEKFAKMLSEPGISHLVINARAGTGKTTVLKHLAAKYCKGGWLYLVFNSKNKEEALEEFPSSCKVDTTNGWAGRDLLSKNHIPPTDRMIDFSFEDKAKMIAESKPFKQLMASFNMPNQEEVYGAKDGRKIPNARDRDLFYILRRINKEFKNEAIRLLGLMKSYAVDPRNEEGLEASMNNVLQKYDVDYSLEDVKEYVMKGYPWANPYLTKIMGGVSFLSRNFADELKRATVWLMQQTMPHTSQEMFLSQKEDPKKGIKKGQEYDLASKRDFDDDFWYAALHANELRWPRYKVVLADEVQDFNVAQKIILGKLAEAGAKVVAVGDPNQSIYRFRGADSNAFKDLEDMLRNQSADKDELNDKGTWNGSKTLTRNFRSRRKVLDLSNQEGRESGHVSDLQQGRDFPEEPGRIGAGDATKDKVSYDDAFDVLKQEKKDMGEWKQTAFLARTNEPLTHAGLRLMKMGIPFMILGKDLAGGLTKHIDKMSDMYRLFANNDVDELANAINDYQREQLEKHGGSVAKGAKLKEIKEMTESMAAAIEQFQVEVNQINEEGRRTGQEEMPPDIDNFRNWLKAKFGGLDIEKSGAEGKKARAEFKKRMKEQNPVILSTVHKSKGLQFQRVNILRDDQWPHPRAERPEDREQEANNKYIGRTRAEDEIHVLKLKGQPGYKE